MADDSRRPQGETLSMKSRPKDSTGQWTRMWENSLFHSFRKSPLVVLSALVCMTFVACAAMAPWISPHNPYDLASLHLINSFLPPFWMEGGSRTFVLGTDGQGADILSGIIYGTRTSLVVGFGSVLVSTLIGVTLGLVSGYFGGKLDALIMRAADIQMTFPAILLALMMGGIAGAVVPTGVRAKLAIPILIASIGISSWVQYARTVRGSTMVEKNKEYVLAARLIGLGPIAVMTRHILRNVMGPVWVLASINLAFAVISEATLSFLGVGVPVTKPSLGMLIRNGNDYLFSGEWWIVIFPSGALVILALAVNLLGDWLRDALNPKLR